MKEILGKTLSRFYGLTGPRPFGFYAAVMGLGPDQLDSLDNERILNAGSGRGDWGPELQRWGVFPQVVFLDEVFRWRLGRWGVPEGSVGGDIKELPFPDGTFDVVVCGYAVLLGLYQNEGEAECMLRELTRVAKKKVFFYPADPRLTELAQKLGMRTHTFRTSRGKWWEMLRRAPIGVGTLRALVDMVWPADTLVVEKRKVGKNHPGVGLLSS